MTVSFIEVPRIVAGAASLIAAVLFSGPLSRAADDDAEAQVRPVFTQTLPNVPGKSLTAIVVSYAPGGKSAEHHHAGSVFAYVLSGAIRSECSATGPVRVYGAGESFFEPPGSEHLVSENASATEPARARQPVGRLRRRRRCATDDPFDK